MWLYDDTIHQLENRHPASCRDLDDADKHHLFEGDVVRPDKPGEVRTVDGPLAVLNPDKFPKSLP
jgi:hypothetical protein